MDSRSGDREFTKLLINSERYLTKGSAGKVNQWLRIQRKVLSALGRLKQTFAQGSYAEMGEKSGFRNSPSRFWRCCWSIRVKLLQGKSCAAGCGRQTHLSISTTG